MTSKFGWCLPGGTHRDCHHVNGKLVCSCSCHTTGVVPTTSTQDTPVIETDEPETEELTPRPSRNLETTDGDQ